MLGKTSVGVPGLFFFLYRIVDRRTIKKSLTIGKRATILKPKGGDMDKELLIRTAKYQYGTVKAYLEAVGISKQRFYAVISVSKLSPKMQAELSDRKRVV